MLRKNRKVRKYGNAIDVKKQMELGIKKKGSKITGCVLRYMPDYANFAAACYIRQALFRGEIFMRFGKLVFACDGESFSFEGNFDDMQKLCHALNIREPNFQQMIGCDEDGCETMIITVASEGVLRLKPKILQMPDYSRLRKARRAKGGVA